MKCSNMASFMVTSRCTLNVLKKLVVSQEVVRLFMGILDPCEVEQRKGDLRGERQAAEVLMHCDTWIHMIN